MQEVTGDRRNSLKTHIREDTLVHAYGIEGARNTVLAELLDICGSALGCITRGNPDFQVLHIDSFTIDDARALEARARERPLGGSRKFFLVAFESITHEAQNALLKLFEEPTVSTHFFLLMPSHEILLPTVRSRLYLISLHSSSTSAQPRIPAFVEASQRERLSLLKSIIESKDKAEAIRFLNELETYLHERQESLNSSEMRDALQDIIHARGYLRARSPSVKMLLEEVALLLPFGK